MPIEIEKKYRVSKRQRDLLEQRLPQIGARHLRDDFEENTLYRGDALDTARSVLRLRRANKRAILTYKERFPTTSSIKRQREDETEVKNPEALDAILDALGFTPALVYEKRRQRWKLNKAEIVLDELPFGLFMEIEADEDEIRRIERALAIKGLRGETATYPQLAQRYGKRNGKMIEARFAKQN
jgi:adenylate cyclase class 2